MKPMRRRQVGLHVVLLDASDIVVPEDLARRLRAAAHGHACKSAAKWPQTCWQLLQQQRRLAARVLGALVHVRQQLLQLLGRFALLVQLGLRAQAHAMQAAWLPDFM